MAAASSSESWIGRLHPTVIDGMPPENSSSHHTHCWREQDSNHRFLSRRTPVLLRKANCGGSNGGGLLKLFLLRGTDGSNPSPSSRESVSLPHPLS
jgi:hypothetical protein